MPPPEQREEALRALAGRRCVVCATPIAPEDDICRPCWLVSQSLARCEELSPEVLFQFDDLFAREIQ